MAGPVPRTAFATGIDDWGFRRHKMLIVAAISTDLTHVENGYHRLAIKCKSKVCKTTWKYMDRGYQLSNGTVKKMLLSSVIAAVNIPAVAYACPYPAHSSSIGPIERIPRSSV
jgi:hypothetical protein